MKLTLRNIRCYTDVGADLSEGISVFYGYNGIGKTTLLEAIYYLATLRSFRTSRQKDLLMAGKSEGVIEGVTSQHHFRVLLRTNGRTLFRDQKKIPSAAQFCTHFSVVALAPEHLSLLYAPEERRKFLDRILSSLQPLYLSVCQRYQRALKHKRALFLKTLPYSVYADQVAPWNDELAQTGDEIRSSRKQLIKKLEPAVQEQYESIAPEGGKVSITYSGSEFPLAQEFQEKSRAEYVAARAFVGAHRDDLKLFLDEQPVEKVASQGELASILLALKWAELIEIEKGKNEKALLLLDDLGVTLDKPRREQLFSRLRMEPRQTWVTTSDEAILQLSLSAGARLYHFQSGQNDEGFSVARWLPA